MALEDVLETIGGGLSGLPGGTLPGELLKGDARVRASNNRNKAERIERWKRLNKGTLSAFEVMQLWVDADGPVNQAAMASVVSKYESRRRLHAVNSASGATGLMQIHPGGDQYKNAWTNMQTAVAKWKAGGWRPWSVCNAAKDPWQGGTTGCENLAREAARLDKRYRNKLGDTGGIVDIPDSLNPVDDVAGAISAIFKPLADFFQIITDADTWLRIGKVLLGAILILFAVNQLTGFGSGLRRMARA